MPIPAIIMGLAQFLPSVLPLLTKNETANKAAEVIGAVAKSVTGKSDEGEALEALKNDPALVLEYQRTLSNEIIAIHESETARLESVNETMQAEAQSHDKIVRRWRPFFGYIVGITWFIQMMAMSYLIVVNPDKAATVITAMAGLSVMWGIALSVLGVAVHSRSKDKAVNQGFEPKGILEGVIETFKK